MIIVAKMRTAGALAHGRLRSAEAVVWLRSLWCYQLQ